jgi:hypothetical protein
MKRPKSALRTKCPLNDFQVFKGRSEQTMRPFGMPVIAHYEAQLIIRDDRLTESVEGPVIYAIYKRSENRIVQILRTPDAEPMLLAA